MNSPEYNSRSYHPDTVQSPLDNMPDLDPEAAVAIAGLLGSDPKGYLDRRVAEESADVRETTRLRGQERASGVPDEELTRYH